MCIRDRSYTVGAYFYQLKPVWEESFFRLMDSVLDIILDKPMEEALSLVKVSRDIEDALIRQSGIFAEPLYFIKQ